MLWIALVLCAAGISKKKSALSSGGVLAAARQEATIPLKKLSLEI